MPKVDSMMENESVPQKRPFGVTLFLWMVLSLSGWGLLRFFAALRWWDVLTRYQSHLSPLYLAITGASWTVVGAVLLWSIWVGKSWARPAIPIAVCLWLTLYWIERLFFEAPRANLPFMIAVNVFILTVTLICTFNRKTKLFLTRSEEHEQPEKHPVSE
jgi:hypothetical protein